MKTASDKPATAERGESEREKERERAAAADERERERAQEQRERKREREREREALTVTPVGPARPTEPGRGGMSDDRHKARERALDGERERVERAHEDAPEFKGAKPKATPTPAER